MRSEHVDQFNHDPYADGYDADVADESHPIRAGYAATLDWVANQARLGPDDAVADLGAGTGNLTERLTSAGRIVCVDASERMLDKARAKLGDRATYEQGDLLEWAHGGTGQFDAVVSSYAAHHLTTTEKSHWLAGISRRLRPGGRLAVGDLMAASRSAVDGLRSRLANTEVDELFAEEFPWFLDDTQVELARLGFTDVRIEQLSDLSWGIAALSHTP